VAVCNQLELGNRGDYFMPAPLPRNFSGAGRAGYEVVGGHSSYLPGDATRCDAAGCRSCLRMERLMGEQPIVFEPGSAMV